MVWSFTIVYKTNQRALVFYLHSLSVILCIRTSLWTVGPDMVYARNSPQ